VAASPSAVAAVVLPAAPPAAAAAAVGPLLLLSHFPAAAVVDQTPANVGLVLLLPLLPLHMYSSGGALVGTAVRVVSFQCCRCCL
jgi:hypothetical protein